MPEPKPDIYELEPDQVVAVVTGRGLVTVAWDGRVYREGLFDGLVPVAEIADTPAVRMMCGGVERSTLLRWRASAGFPQPLEPTMATVALWDAREVRAWLEGYQPQSGRPRGAKSRRRRRT